MRQLLDFGAGLGRSCLVYSEGSSKSAAARKLLVGLGAEAGVTRESRGAHRRQ